MFDACFVEKYFRCREHSVRLCNFSGCSVNISCIRTPILKQWNEFLYFFWNFADTFYRHVIGDCQIVDNLWGNMTTLWADLLANVIVALPRTCTYQVGRWVCKMKVLTIGDVTLCWWTAVGLSWQKYGVQSSGTRELSMVPTLLLEFGSAKRVGGLSGVFRGAMVRPPPLVWPLDNLCTVFVSFVSQLNRNKIRVPNDCPCFLSIKNCVKLHRNLSFFSSSSGLRLNFNILKTATPSR